MFRSPFAGCAGTFPTGKYAALRAAAAARAGIARTRAVGINRNSFQYAALLHVALLQNVSRLAGIFPSASQSFAARTPRKRCKSFFPAACTSGKIRLGLQTCEQSECDVAGRIPLLKNRFAVFQQFGFHACSSDSSGSTRSMEMTRLPSSTRMRITPCVSRL